MPERGGELVVCGGTSDGFLGFSKLLDSSSCVQLFVRCGWFMMDSSSLDCSSSPLAVVVLGYNRSMAFSTPSGSQYSAHAHRVFPSGDISKPPSL